MIDYEIIIAVFLSMFSFFVVGWLATTSARRERREYKKFLADMAKKK